jgi:hypothetical protein
MTEDKIRDIIMRVVADEVLRLKRDRHVNAYGRTLNVVNRIMEETKEARKQESSRVFEAGKRAGAEEALDVRQTLGAEKYGDRNWHNGADLAFAAGLKAGARVDQRLTTLEEIVGKLDPNVTDHEADIGKIEDALYTLGTKVAQLDRARFTHNMRLDCLERKTDGRP